MIQQSTLKQLSEVLGLSISTVSRALKDHPDISEKTKIKVKELAQAMEYEPNSYAVQLRTKNNNVLGILLPTINNFFYDSFISAVEDEARLHGYSVLIMQSMDKLQIENSSLNLFRKNMVAGLFVSISIETDDPAPFLKLNELKTPVIFFDRVPDTDACNKVCLADADAARLAAETIIAKKKKKVLALFGHPHLNITKKRLASFRETVARLSPDTQVAYSFPEQSAQSRLDTLAALDGADRPDVIFCMGDMILIGVMYAIHERRLRVPEDIAIVSISNGLLPTLYDPKITHIETNGYKLGKLAFAQMHSCLQGNDQVEEVFVESKLIEGGSI
ncbi:LacI family DNA-binding transcriptional regulator [Sediminibacterium soli]|uniref:LacI family DNA-binding transcriptional regulator n=1 Tax=Sediminibacterium soli TaxID=2698829 RepID=UPI00137A9B06|nr:LacI family DNA-binding transcriptional regulator [Sediminibacterium soli]NCI47379.1 LacI family transcriptional regulator [Sediminibacterium soli]